MPERIKENNMTPQEVEFIALARNAFDVMVNRGWGVRRWHGHESWVVLNNQELGIDPSPIVDDEGMPFNAFDPFTALVEADKWMKQQEAVT